MRLACPALLALLLLPSTLAGTPDDPEVVDARGDAAPIVANEYADALAAWFEAGEDEVVVRLTLAKRGATPDPLTAYLIVFDPGPASLYAGVVVTTGETFGVYGPWDRERGMPTSGGDRIEGGFDGLTAYARIPRGALGDERALSEPGIRVVSYATTQIDEALGFLVLDAADGGRAFPLGSAGAASPETETRGAAAPPATAVPGVGFASFLAVAGAAALGCRARR